MSSPSDSLWTVEYHRDLESELRRLPRPYIKRILEALENLAVNPRPYGSEKMSGQDLWKMRVGVYRVLYEINDSQHSVRTYRVGHRREVYRNL